MGSRTCTPRSPRRRTASVLPTKSTPTRQPRGDGRAARAAMHRRRATGGFSPLRSTSRAARRQNPQAIRLALWPPASRLNTPDAPPRPAADTSNRVPRVGSRRCPLPTPAPAPGSSRTTSWHASEVADAAESIVTAVMRNSDARSPRPTRPPRPSASPRSPSARMRGSMSAPRAWIARAVARRGRAELRRRATRCRSTAPQSPATR